MKKRLLFVASVAIALAGLTTLTQAQIVSQRSAEMPQSTKSISQASPAMAASGLLREAMSIEEYGTLEEVLYEDFSLMSAGTEQVPDKSVDMLLKMGEYEYPWWNLKPEYTKQPHWGGNNIYPAGGTVALCPTVDVDLNERMDMANVNTCLANLDLNGGAFVVSFRAKVDRSLTDQEAARFIVETAETYNMGPTWRIIGSESISELSTEWKTYHILFQAGGPSTIVNFHLTYGARDQGSVPGKTFILFMDDIRLSSLKPFVAEPILDRHYNYRGAEFDLKWKAVDGADRYLVNVFTKNPETGVIDYLHKGLSTTETSIHIVGATPGELYWWSVQAGKGDKLSLESLPKFVDELPAPEMLPHSEVQNNAYVANWKPLHGAEIYRYLAYAKRRATSDGIFVITREDFTGVKDLEGNPTEWTVDNPNPYRETYSRLFIPEFKQKGWHVTYGAPYKDYYCLDAWQYIVGKHNNAGLISPQLDLSKNGGKVTVKARFWASEVTYTGQDDQEHTGFVNAAVALFNYNPETSSYDQVQLVYAKDLKNEWSEHTFELSGASSQSIIGIFAVTLPDNLYVDDLLITQEYKAGEELWEPFFCAPVVKDATSVEVKVPVEELGVIDFTHRVQALRLAVRVPNTDPNLDPQFVESPFSDFQVVEGNFNTTKLPELEFTGRVYVQDGYICIENPGGEMATVYDLAGQAVASTPLGKFTHRITLPAGNYVVKIGTGIFKVVL